jgi:hypothetical protein
MVIMKVTIATHVVFPDSEPLDVENPQTRGVAQLSLVCEDGQVFATFMTKDELFRHICAALATYKTMDHVAELMGGEWTRTYVRRNQPSSADSSS